MKKYEMKQVMVDPFDIMCGECQEHEIEVWEEVSVEGLYEMHEQFLQNDEWMDEADKQYYEDVNGEPWKPTPETFDEFLAEAERTLLIESLCNEQSLMLKNNPEAYASERWVMLENLKVRFKE